MNAEEILRDKINSHSWGYSYENIQSTEGFANDFLNIALAAMETYKEQSSDARYTIEQIKAARPGTAIGEKLMELLITNLKNQDNERNEQGSRK